MTDQPAPLTDQQLNEYEQLAARTADDPFFVSDCEGKLAVWREKALVRVTRDEHGQIDGYSLPPVYTSTDEVIEAIYLDSWDPGEDATDDRRRQDANDLVDGRAAVGVLLAEVHRLREAMDQIRHTHKDSPMGPCPVCVDGDAMARGEDYTVPYPCPTARLAGAQDCDPPSFRPAAVPTT